MKRSRNKAIFLLEGLTKKDKIPHRIYLSEDEMPKQWYNLRADMKELPDPLLNPATLKPATEEDLYPVFLQRACSSGNG